MMTRIIHCGYFENGSKEEPMELTMAEKREFLERIRELTMIDVIRRAERDEIYRILLAAADRELARLREE